MQIDFGLFPHMVMQRSAKDVSRQPVSGRCAAGAPLHLRVEKDGKPLRGFADRRLRKADDKGRFSISITGLPSGGPYTLRLSAGDEQMVIEDVLVGDVWVLAGQSNMAGLGRIDERCAKPIDAVRCFHMEEEWRPAEDPLHQPELSPLPAHRLLKPQIGVGNELRQRSRKKPKKGVGPGVFFGQAMYRRHGIPQGLIASAQNGTSTIQWKPSTSVKTLFGATLHRIKQNGGRVAGILWYQGASDTEPAERRTAFAARTRQIIKRFRDHLGPLPFIMGQLGRNCVPEWSKIGYMDIRDQQRRLGESIPKAATVPSIDLPLDDLVHIGTDGQAIFAERLAEAMDSQRFGRKRAMPPIALDRIEITQLPKTRERVLRVRFTNVIGSLCAPGGRASGFAFMADGNLLGAIYRCSLERSSVILHPVLSANDLADAQLVYGYGTDAFCNIVDEGGRSLPCFGPLQVGKGLPKTDFAHNLQASKLLPWPGAIEAVPLAPATLRYRPVPVQRFYNPLHDMQNRDGSDKLVYFRYRFRCSEAMRLDCLFDFDGPAKLWLDGEERWCDATCRNPMFADRITLPISVGPGDHEIIAALGSNGGHACGLTLRLARRDKNRGRDGTKPPMPELI